MLSGIPAPSHFSEKLLTSLRQSSNDTPRPTPRVFSWGKVFTLAGIKHSEMPEECHQYKGRIVYRGDRITEQSGQTVFFTENETATTPTATAALNLTLWFGAMTTVMVLTVFQHTLTQNKSLNQFCHLRVCSQRGPHYISKNRSSNTSRRPFVNITRIHEGSRCFKDRDHCRHH